LDGTRLALIRHGAYHQLDNTPSALQPFPLSDEGQNHARQGARELAQGLQTLGWKETPQLHSSVLLRAWQTAEIYAQTLGLSVPPEQSPALCERSVGSAANLSIKAIEALLADDPRYLPPPRDWKSRSDYRLPLPGAESLDEAGARVAQYILSQCAANGERKPVQLFVGHGAAFRHAARDLGILETAEIPGLSMHHGRGLLFEYRDKSWTLLSGAWKTRRTEARD